jgi:hypothetical protein
MADTETLKVDEKSSPDELRRAAEVREQQLRTVKEYPRWRYHRTKPAVLVQSPDEEKNLGSGYGDAPYPENPPWVPGTPRPETDAKSALQADVDARRAEGEATNRAAAAVKKDADAAEEYHKAEAEKTAPKAKSAAAPKAKAAKTPKKK